MSVASVALNVILCIVLLTCNVHVSPSVVVFIQVSADVSVQN